ncbi:ABC transporter related protein [Sulfobacillus acidophilus DSM 10332]|uniref:ABC transporter related protein n=1 Tax=Sulfobacillus acidophilus (strain ATCC 700253 / DSM 10332 / NAL) TaxID=679936 RepID=G8TZE6_SULAD|nr:ABC transporter related protein [Sulfobacillus acidophilus DSM 10332]
MSKNGDDVAFRCENLALSFGSTVVWKDVNVTISLGCVIGLIGLNGSGKTSFLRTLSGLLAPTGGMVTGVGYAAKPSIHHCVLLEETNLFYPQLTCQEMVEFYAGVAGARSAQMESLVQELGLLPVIHHRVQALSQGYRTRLALAFPLMSPARVLLLDEIFNGLDVVAIELIKNVFQREAMNGRTIIVSSHQLEVLDKMADTFLVIHNQTIDAIAPTDIRGKYGSLQALLTQ